MKIAACTMVRDEARHIEEWMAHHLAVGFDTLFVFDNASSDDTAALVARAGRTADVRLVPWTLSYPRGQNDTYRVATGAGTGEFDWMAFIDADEFVVSDGHENIKDFLARMDSASAVFLNWAIFGSSGHEEDPAGGILANYLRRAPDAFGPNIHGKMIVRPSKVVDVVNPHFMSVEGETVDANGTPVSWHIPGLCAGPPVLSPFRVHHYFTRSRAEWGRRLARRSRFNPRTWEDFDSYDRNEILDQSALLLADDTRAIVECFRAA